MSCPAMPALRDLHTINTDEDVGAATVHLYLRPVSLAAAAHRADLAAPNGLASNPAPTDVDKSLTPYAA